VDEASEAAAVAAAAAAAVEGVEEAAAVVAGEAVQKESAEILGRRRELATRDMAPFARGVRGCGGHVARVFDWRRSGSYGGFNGGR
jgi:hypothetical protein